MPQKICIVCGKLYETFWKPERKYCSKKCYGIDKIGKPNMPTIGLIPPNKNLQEITCLICGKKFYVSLYRKHTAKYCSTECSHESKRRVTGTNHKLWTRVKMECELCGKVVWVKPAKINEFRFCSRKCQGTYTSRQMSEKKGPTSIELAIMKDLDTRGIPYKTQYIIAVWLVDIAIPEFRVAIECDGDYWHSSEIQKQKDENKNHWLQAHKWTIIRFSETDIKESPKNCVDKIIPYISGIVTQRH